MMIEVSTEELCEINCMTRDCKNQSESDRADLQLSTGKCFYYVYILFML